MLLSVFNPDATENILMKLLLRMIRNTALPLILIILMASILSGCIAAAGAGAAGGYEFNKHYEIKKKKQAN